MHLDALLADEPLTGGLEPRLGRAHLRTLTSSGFPIADLAGAARRAQPARLPLSLVDPRDLPRQDRRHEAADPHPPAMVRQAQVDRGDPEGGDDQRGVGRCSTPTPPTRRSTPTRRCRSSAPTSSAQAYVTATVTVWDEDPAHRRRTAAPGREGRSRAATSPACARPSTRSRPGSAACPAMSTPMSASRRSRPSTSPI